MYHFTKKNDFNIENNRIKRFLQQQISRLELFLKDHVALKTAVMSFAITGINNILKYCN